MYISAWINMYNFDSILHTNLEVFSMYIMLDIQTEFEIKSLTDLPKLKLLMENLNMKINKSQLARELALIVEQLINT